MDLLQELESKVANLEKGLGGLRLDLKAELGSIKDDLESNVKQFFDDIAHESKAVLNEKLFIGIQSKGETGYKVEDFVRWVKSTNEFKSWLIGQRLKGNPRFNEKAEGRFIHKERQEIEEY